MKRKRSILLAAANVFMILLIVLMLLLSSGHVTDNSFLHTVSYLGTMSASVDGGPVEKVKLPHSFPDLKPRTPITLTASFTPEKRDTIYIKSVYTPMKVYINDKLVYQFGKKDDYPFFMLDPATEVHIIELEESREPVQLRIDCLSPSQRSSMIMHKPIIGTSKNVIFNRFHKLALPLIFSIAQILGGLSLICISIFIIFLDKKGILYLWLGLFSFTTGIWSFGENNFTGVVFKNPTFLYLLAFIGLFTFIIPLLRFTRSIIDFKDKRSLTILEVFFTICIIITLILQFTGTVAFSRSMYLFHLFLPPSLVFLSFKTIKEYVKEKNVNARRFILPISMLALFSLLEVFNYKFSFTFVFSSLFQMGIILFLLIMGIIAAISIKDSITYKNKEKELEFQKKMMDIQIADQKKKGTILAHKEDILRQERHDLRHQLTAIQGLVHEDNTELKEFLDSLMQQIPGPQENYCENKTVNSIISHFATMCQEKHIQLDLHLVVPRCSNGIADSELCVIFGNLLENAVEACDRMTGGKRYISMKSKMQYDLLVITMDNSFNGKVNKREEHYVSSKRDDIGVGLESVRTMAEKNEGSAKFYQKDNVFYSSVYLKLP